MEWKNICEILPHAHPKNEMEYQKFIKDVILKAGLGWKDDQIEEQSQVQIGSTKRIIPDLKVRKDNRNSFVIEVKKPGHKKTNGDIAQLVSYMKQFETPVGIYWGDELEVYYKTLGDGSDPILLMNLRFKESQEDGSRFIALFSEANFCIDIVREYKQERAARLLFDSKVKELTAEVTSTDFAQEVKILIKSHLQAKGLEQEVIDTVIDKVSVALTIEKEPNTEENKTSDDKFQAEERNFNRRRTQITYKWIPSKEKFVERLKQGLCFRHFVMKNGDIHTESWSSSGKLTIDTLQPNINSTVFYRKNKSEIREIILSPFSDPKQEII